MYKVDTTVLLTPTGRMTSNEWITVYVKIQKMLNIQQEFLVSFISKNPFYAFYFLKSHLFSIAKTSKQNY